MLIPLAEYARRHGRRVDVARHMAKRGGFTSAKKMGRDWFVDEDEVWPDRRVKDGKYREKYRLIRESYAAGKQEENSLKS